MVLHVRHVDDLRELLGDHPDQVRPRVFLAEEVHLHVDVRIETEPGVRRFHAHAGRHELVVLRIEDLTAAPLVDDDVLRLDADGHQVAGDFRHDLRHRHRAGCARGIDLDADEVLGVEEARPAVARILVAGERRHSARNHRLYGRHVDLFRHLIDALG